MRVLREIDFFGKKMFLIFFRLLSGELSYFGNESPTDCQKCVWSVSRNFFQGYCFFSESFFNSLVFSLRKWSQIFEEIKKIDFWPEKISTLVIVGFHASRELFADFFPGKESIAKTFWQLERKFVMFCRNFPADSWKAHHCLQMNLLSENMFLLLEK